MSQLPIDLLLPEVRRTLERHRNLIVEAPPGAGKTTRVPPAILDANHNGRDEVLILEPRRLAARLSAQRVAAERGERAGETVGYQIRFEDVSGPRTRIRFLTEGLLSTRLLRDPQLTNVKTVILDEFHERHVQGDLALALLARLQRESRPDLQIVVMSATLDAAPIADFLDDCDVLRSQGRSYPVAIEHAAGEDERALPLRVAAALRKLLREGIDGDVLVFLPGGAEIRRTHEACLEIAAEYDVMLLALHGDLPIAEQERAIRPAEKRKAIFSTNIAETSITIENIAAVIDSGLARTASHSPWSGLPTTEITRISRASAIQRAGRAGRTRAGRCLRLYTQRDFNLRPAAEVPEIRRADLAGLVLTLHASGVTNTDDFRWYETPPTEAVRAAEILLRKLGALDSNGRINDVGRSMLRFSLHPRLSRLLLETVTRGCARAGCAIVALINEKDIRRRTLFQQPDGERVATWPHADGLSDVLELYDLFSAAASADFEFERVRALGLDLNIVRTVDRLRRQLESVIVKSDKANRKSLEGERAYAANDRDLLISILAGFPDRVARRRKSPDVKGRALTTATTREVQLAGGASAEIATESVVTRAEFLVAVALEERRGINTPNNSGAKRQETKIRIASAIEPDWLLDLYFDQIEERTDVRWNAAIERVETIRSLQYDGLVLDESPAATDENDAATAAETNLLREHVRAADLAAFADAAGVKGLIGRINFLADLDPEKNHVRLSEKDVWDVLMDLCDGRRGFAEVREVVRAGGLHNALRRCARVGERKILDRLAPEKIALNKGRQLRVNYEEGQMPWVASRLQDFFGMKQGPAIADGRVRLVLHLLAPNGRAVQVTTDLAGFWANHYPRVRKELGRRYPRHAWPENPLV